METSLFQKATALVEEIYEAGKKDSSDDLVEVRWFSTAEVQPANGQKVIVRTQTGEVYFLTYPFSHTKYPQWWVIPQNNE